MTLPANPPITLDQVCTEFGAPVGTPLHAFLRGGAWVPDIADNDGVPTVLPITLHQLCGATKYVPLVIGGPTEVDWSGSPSKPIMYYHTGSQQTVSGGDGTYTYSWQFVSGSTNIYCSNKTTLNGDFYASGGYDPGTGETQDFTLSATWNLTVSDGVTSKNKNVLFKFSSIGGP